MRRVSISALVVTALTVGALHAQAPTVSSVVRLDPAMDAVVSPNAKVELLKGEFFAFVEGPVWVREGRSGHLLFSDIPANCIYKWQDGKLSVFLEKSGFSGTDTSNVGVEVNNGRFQVIVIGSNGLTLDPQGRLVAAAMGDRQLVRLEKDGKRTVLADRYDGKRFNGVNDVVVKSNGSVYFTDPSSGLRGGDKNPLRELPFNGVYLVKAGKVTLLDKEPIGGSPNGIAFSPNERILYVTAGRRLAAYDVQPDDTLTNRRVFFDYDKVIPPVPPRGGFDGIKVDTQGNVWGEGPGGIWIVSPAGKALGSILIPEPPANLAFGEADGKTLFMTARRGLYRVRINVAGILPGPK